MSENHGEALSPLSFIKRNYPYILLAAVIAFAIFVLVGRSASEKACDNLEITADFASLSEFAKSNSLDFKSMMYDFKKAGLSSVAFSEDNIESLAFAGRLSLFFGYELKKKLPDLGIPYDDISPEKSYAAVYSADAARELKTFSFLSLPDMKTIYMPENISHDNPAVFEFAISRKSLETSLCGFSLENIESCSSMGFGIILRPENRQNINPEKIDSFLSLLKREYHADKLLFAGSDNDVIGYPYFMENTAAAIKREGLIFGIMEAANAKSMQKGIQALGLKCPENAVRLMTIVPLQQRRLTVDGMIEKYSLGMRERNIRVIFIRPHLAAPAGVSPLELNVSYISGIAAAALSNGLKLGISFPFRNKPYPVSYAFIISFGALLGFIILARLLKELGSIRCSAKIELACLILWVILAAVMIFTGKISLYRKLAALAAGVSFPLSGILMSFNIFKDLLGKHCFSDAWKKSSLALCNIVLMSSAGGIIIASILASPEFYIQADMFRGIKLVMIVAPICSWLLWIAGDRGIADALKDIAGKSIRFIHAFAAFFLAGIGGYYILRTGNASEGSVSKTELSMRSLLTGILTVRPRFKEFALGFPAVMLFGTLRLFGLERLSWLLVIAAAVGAADVTDTFAHIHTPISITAIRVASGAIIGWIIGSCMLAACFFLGSKYCEKKVENTPEKRKE